MRAARLLVAASMVASLGCGESGTASATAPALIDELDLGAAGGRSQPAAARPDPPVRSRVIMPAPAQRRGAWAVTLNRACESCHTTEAEQWQASRHHHADSNAAYRAAFEREERSPFCTSCHAPEATLAATSAAPDRRLGVGCVSCHVVGDDADYTVLAAASAHASSAAPHPLSRSDAFSMAGACASCHEFRFAGRVGERPQAFMQTTVREMAQLAGEQASCAECHMAAADGTASHAFDVRNPEWLRAGLEASASLLEEGDLELRLSQRRAGHAFPTGDLFRRLQLGARWLDADGRPLEQRTDYLARHFVLSPGIVGRALVADDRVRSGPSTVVLERSDTTTAARSLRWWVTLQRVATVGDGRDPDAATIESEVTLHSGVLALPPPP